MNATPRKTELLKKESKEETKKKQDEKLKKGVRNFTPRSFVQKSSTADIYSQKKKTTETSTRVSQKSVTNTRKEIPLKSSQSAVSQRSISDLKKVNSIISLHSARKIENSDSKTLSSVKKKETTKKPILTNVTVNSPIAKKRLDVNSEHVSSKVNTANAGSQKKSDGRENKQTAARLSRQASNVSKDIPTERPRTKTRTLDENEVKILKPAVVDNNAGMISLAQTLTARPKAFFIDLDEGQSQSKKEKSSEEEFSYEDDFESYESDFESYQSDQTSDKSETSDKIETSEKSESSEHSARNEETYSVDESCLKEKDEERMLDSGNFDLRDQRSAKPKSSLDFILEGEEVQRPASLTDEGFQDMSSSSAGSSLKVQQAEGSMFLDLKKSKQSKRKRKINERLQQRAKDLLGMITLHEMSYSLYEMQPISYDLYMATFGRSNYTQTGVQTFDDGITEEIQTDEVVVSQKWTQHPVEFSNSDIYMVPDKPSRKYSKHTEDYLTKFTFMMKDEADEQDVDIVDDTYKTNPLRVFLEQRDGAGPGEILPYESFKLKLNSNNYNSNKLGKFLKKCESKLSHVLNKNTDHNENIHNLTKSSSIPFSNGYFVLSAERVENEKLFFLKKSKISHLIFSETKSHLMLTVHKNVQHLDTKKSLICLWDLSVTRIEPIKFLIVIDSVAIGRFRGNSNGLFVAALDDGSIHLWDLTEEPTWRSNGTNDKKSAEIVEIDNSKMTDIERDREWNLKNSHVELKETNQIPIALNPCAFTSSGATLTNKETVDRVIGLEMDTTDIDSGKRTLGQIISLQRVGTLIIWSIIQEKLKSSKDIGKAYLSKLKLEKCQTVNLIDHIDVNFKQSVICENGVSFNLNAAKKRLSLKKKEKLITKVKYSRPQSAVATKFDFDIDRPSGAASMRKRILPVETNYPKGWETGLVCNNLKVMRVGNIDHYLIGKNCGEVLCCRRCLGTVRVQRFSISADTSAVTNIEVSRNGLPYFLAATDTGTVNFCSVLDNRVLLTLDCRNTPSSQPVEKCKSDSKGRFVSTIMTKQENIHKPLSKLDIKSVHWSSINPCSVYVLLQDCSLVLFELTHSDIYAKFVSEGAAVQSTARHGHLALLTPSGEVQVHRLPENESLSQEYLKIFEKYVALL